MLTRHYPTSKLNPISITTFNSNLLKEYFYDMYTRTIYRHTVLNTISTLCRLLYFVEGLLRPFLYLHRSDKLNLSQKQKTKTSITLWMDRGTKICKCHLSFYPPYKWRLIAAHRVKPSLKRKLLCVISAKKVRKIGPPRSLLF